MRIELIKYDENIDRESSLKGSALVEIDGKMNAWFSIIKSKKGGVFCTPSSVRVGKEFKPSFTLRDAETMRKLCSKVLKAVVEKYTMD